MAAWHPRERSIESCKKPELSLQNERTFMGYDKKNMKRTKLEKNSNIWNEWKVQISHCLT